MAFLGYIVILSMLGTALVTGQDYCSVCSDHTMCLYDGIGDACQGSFGRGVDDDGISQILGAHNQYRSNVAQGLESRGSPGPQPSASDMLELVWDDELATIAQTWADQCTFEHDSCRNTETESVGQNLYISFSSVEDNSVKWNDAVNSWYEEVVKFDNSIVENYSFDPNTGHYTQVVWADTKYIGCGYSTYQEDGWYKNFYVCNYGPSGNYIGDKMYTEGTSASNCPSGTSAQYPGLCA